jgi:hypothetical protein
LSSNFTCFHIASGLKVIFLKSRLFGIGVNESDLTSLASLLESLAYHHARPLIFSNDQGHTHLQSFVFHPIYKNLHGNPSGKPSLRHFVQLPPPHEPSQHFESLFSSYKKIESSQ